MVSPNQVSASSGNDRYHSLPTASPDSLRSHNLTGNLDQLSNFDLLLALPLFENNIQPVKDVSSTVEVESSITEDSKEQFEKRDEHDSLEPTNAVVFVLPYEELKPIPKIEPQREENSNYRRESKSEKVDNHSRKNSTEHNSDKPTSHSSTSHRPAMEATAPDTTKDVTSETIKPSVAAPVLTKKIEPDTSESELPQVQAATENSTIIDDAQHGRERKREQVTASVVETPTISTVDHHIRPQDSSVENSAPEETIGELDETFSENDVAPRLRRTERLENIRNRQKNPSDPQDSREAVSISALNNNEKTEVFQADTLSATSPSDTSHVELVGLTETQPTIVSAVAFDSTPNATPGITATSGLTGARETRPPAVTSSSDSTNGGVNSSSGVTGSQTNARATTSTSGSASTGRSSLTPYQEQKILQRVLHGMEQLANGSNQVRLRLHPPELGTLQVTIRIEAQQVAALIEVEHVSARDALQNNLPQLQARLADQGLSVQQFEIRVVDPNQFSQGDQLGGTWHHGNQQSTDQRNERRANNYPDRLRNRIETQESEPSRSPTRLWTRTHGQIDLRV